MLKTDFVSLTLAVLCVLIPIRKEKTENLQFLRTILEMYGSKSKIGIQFHVVIYFHIYLATWICVRVWNKAIFLRATDRMHSETLVLVTHIQLFGYTPLNIS